MFTLLVVAVVALCVLMAIGFGVTIVAIVIVRIVSGAVGVLGIGLVVVAVLVAVVLSTGAAEDVH